MSAESKDTINKQIDEITSKWLIESKKWHDWEWQMQNRITTIEQLDRYMAFKIEDRERIRQTMDVFPMSVTPYYASLMDPSDPNCPIRRQAIPDVKELEVLQYEMEDPLCEDKDSPVTGLTHRYPDRVLLLATNNCSMNCRHCTRKRKVGDQEQAICMSQIIEGIKYIRENPTIRDVLISGGDPLILSDDRLEKIIRLVRAIPHVEIIRIGTRMPVVLPQRITPELVEMLKKYHPIWINTHFNHPREITPQSEKALRLLADGGIPLGNQSVLLRGVNNCPDVMKQLVHLLVKNRVRPYYIYQCDLSHGIEHFRTPISQGVEIMERLIGHTSGLAIPRYICDAPGGGGKIPIQPNYMVSQGHGKTVLRNYEGVISVYREPVNMEEYRKLCPADCNLCGWKCSRSQDEIDPVGVEKLMVHDSTDVSLIPEGNIRAARFTMDEDEQ